MYDLLTFLLYPTLYRPFDLSPSGEYDFNDVVDRILDVALFFKVAEGEGLCLSTVTRRVPPHLPD